MLRYLDTIRVWGFGDSPDDEDFEQRCPPLHAPTYLASYLQRVRSLEILPSMTRHERALFTEQNGFPDDVVGDPFFDMCSTHEHAQMVRY